MTALQAGREYAPLLQARRQRRQSTRRARLAAARQARQIGEACARHLVERYDAQRVYLFGSAVGGERLHAASDIDLAVEGLPLDRYFRALADLWALLPPGLHLDLVPLECAAPGLAAHVRKEGLLLHARRDVLSPTL